MSTEGAPRVLSIQSHVVSGYVGNKCAVFPLQALGLDVDFINSVQFSNHTGYGKWRGQVLGHKELDDLYEGLVEQDLAHYTQLLTGYVGDKSFLHRICDVVRQIKKDNPHCLYLCDPVLGDNGHFYVPEELIPVYANELLPLADITTPNTFELELLSGMKINSEADALKAMNVLHDKGVAIVVLSSLDSEGTDLCTYASVQHESQRRIWKVVSPRLEGIFTGTGDLFAAIFLGRFHMLKNNKDSVPEALRMTLATMQTVLKRTKAIADKKPKSDTRPTELQLVQSLDVILKPNIENVAVAVAVSV